MPLEKANRIILSMMAGHTRNGHHDRSDNADENGTDRCGDLSIGEE